MADRFLEAGFSEDEVITMAVTNTRRLAGGAVASRRIQVIGAHSADFVWRAGGADRRRDRSRRGGRGHRAQLRRARRVGRAVEGWRVRPSRTSRRSAMREAEAAAAHLGSDISLHWTSVTIRSQIGGPRSCWVIAEVIREFAPDVLVTHTDTDPFNPDHPVAYAAVDRARSLAAGGRRPVGEFATIKPPAALPLRAPPAGAVQLHAEHVRRHNGGDGSEARGDGRR